jgi:hypothetical protein
MRVPEHGGVTRMLTLILTAVAPGSKRSIPLKKPQIAISDPFSRKYQRRMAKSGNLLKRLQTLWREATCKYTTIYTPASLKSTYW